jgi:hypothetical protein
MNLRFNHCYSICSTVRNRICSFRPRSEFLPDGGDYLAERNAEDMSALNEGWSAQVGRQRTMSLWFRDLEVCDAAFVKLYRDGRNIELGRFPAWEFLLDEVETMYGKVETMHHVQFLPVETVSARYGIDTEKLMAEAITMGPGIPYYAPRQVIRVVDSYSGAMEVEDEKAEGGWRTEMGRHTIFVGRTHVVLDEDWEWEGPPVVIGTFEEGMTGVLGVSAVRMLRGIQEATNEWCARMENSHAMSSLQVWQVAEGENGPSKINNADVRIERYASRPSNVINPPPMGTEAYNWSKLLRDEGYATIGVSQFIAAGIKQPQTSSGVAIDNTSELQTDRLALLSQLWEQSNNDVDRWWMRLCRQAAKEGIKPKWKSLNESGWRMMEYGDPETEWETRPMATSVFGQTVSARLTKATEMLNAKAISVEEWREVVQLPDLRRMIQSNPEYAERLNMERICDRCLEDGDLRMPGPYVDPQKMYDYARARFNLAESDDKKYPPEHMMELSRLIDAMKGELDKGAPAAAPAGPPALPAMPGAPLPGAAPPAGLAPPPPTGMPLGLAPPPAQIGGPVPPVVQ